MNIHLTSQQQQALALGPDGPARVIDPRTNTVYILVPEADYDTVREILEDEKRQELIQAISLRNAIGRMSEDQ